MLVRSISDDYKTQVHSMLFALVFGILRHAVSFQGCSACLVPAIYGFIPCAVGFVFRTSQAVLLSTIGVLLAIAFIFGLDLSDNCPSDPIDPDDKATIIADRLIPLLMLILGNSSILIIILRQSQESLLLSAKAAKAGFELANMRRDLLNRVTHELRTPLNGLVGSIELLTVSETLPEQDMENVQTIKRCLDGILDICDDVLLASRADSAATESKKFILAACVDNVAEIFAATVHAKGLQLHVEFDGDTTAVVYGMESKLKQVLLNLVGNALKFTERGSITIRVCTRELGETEDNGMLRCLFEVEDTGRGVDSKDAHALFEPFHQGEKGSAIRRRYGGTGLGLTICKEVVELMGGTIAIDGKIGKGSRFYFELLLQRERKTLPALFPSVVDRESEPVHSPCKRVVKIVIAESDEACRVSCLSLVKSIAPSSVDIATFDSNESFLGHIENEGLDDNATDTIRIAILGYDPAYSEFASMLSELRQKGWLIFVHCDQFDFANALTKSAAMSGLLRRPLPLVRTGILLKHAIDGKTTSVVALEEKVKPTADQHPENHEESAANAVSSEIGTMKNASPGFASTEHTEKAVTMTSIPDVSSTARPCSKVVVVDDTPLNVKLLMKMLSRSTKIPILSLDGGQAAIDFAKSSHRDDQLLFMMDFHMPVVCGITATEAILKVARKRGGPSVHICMVTADTEGLQTEIGRRQIKLGAALSNGVITRNESDGETEPVGSERDGFVVIDVVAGKPITFKSIQAILTWFEKRLEHK